MISFNIFEIMFSSTVCYFTLMILMMQTTPMYTVEGEYKDPVSDYVVSMHDMETHLNTTILQTHIALTNCAKEQAAAIRYKDEFIERQSSSFSQIVAMRDETITQLRQSMELSTALKDDEIETLERQVATLQNEMRWLKRALNETQEQLDLVLVEAQSHIGYWNIVFFLCAILAVLFVLSVLFSLARHAVFRLSVAYRNLDLCGMVCSAFSAVMSVFRSCFVRTGEAFTSLRRDRAPSAEYIQLEALMDGSRLMPAKNVPDFQIDIQVFSSSKWTTLGNASVIRVDLLGSVIVTVHHVLPAFAEVRLVPTSCRDGSKFVIVDASSFIVVEDHDLAYLPITPQMVSVLGVKTAKVPMNLARELPQIVSITGVGYTTSGCLSFNPTVFGGLLYEGSTIPGFSGAPYSNNRTIYGLHMGSGTVGIGMDISYVKIMIMKKAGLVKEASEDAIMHEIMEEFKTKKTTFRARGSVVQYKGKYYDMDLAEFEVPKEFWDAVYAVDSKGQPIELEVFNDDAETVPEQVAPLPKEELISFLDVEESGNSPPAEVAQSQNTRKLPRNKKTLYRRRTQRNISGLQLTRALQRGLLLYTYNILMLSKLQKRDLSNTTRRALLRL